MTSLGMRAGLVEIKNSIEYLQSLFFSESFSKYPKKNHVSIKVKNMILPWDTLYALIQNII